FLIYSPVLGIISQQLHIREAKEALEYYQDSWSPGTPMPEAGLYHWERSQWRLYEGRELLISDLLSVVRNWLTGDRILIQHLANSGLSNPALITNHSSASPNHQLNHALLLLQSNDPIPNRRVRLRAFPLDALEIKL